MRHFRPFFTLLIVVFGFKLMTIALPLMNKPSSAAFYLGGTLLLVAVAGTLTAVRLLWTWS